MQCKAGSLRTPQALVYIWRCHTRPSVDGHFVDMPGIGAKFECGVMPAPHFSLKIRAGLPTFRYSNAFRYLPFKPFQEAINI